MKNYLRYVYAILAVPLAVLLQFALMPLTGPGTPYVTLFPVTVFVALLGGLVPAILTGILGALTVDYLFIPPFYTALTSIEDISRMVIMVLTSVFVGYVGDVMRAARAKAEKQASALRDSQQDLNHAQAVAHSGSWRLDVRQNKLSWSDEAYRIFGVPTGTALTYESFLTFIHPEDSEYVDMKWQAALGGEKYDIEHRIIVGDTIKWVRERAELELDKDGTLLGGFGTVTDITERKKAEESLRQIEWLLSPKKAQNESYRQPYGDLTEINTCRTLLDSVGKDVLGDIVNDYLDLLDTSAAVYEKNGDYAVGLFTSGWCKFLDMASHRLCGTEDNRAALAGGAWHCHESCWTEASKAAIETGQPVDIECRGGIRLYAVPIWAGEQIIGAMNFGYGNPPQEPRKLQEIAARYNVSVEELGQQAKAYESRPPFIIGLAKDRLKASAKLIGEIFERKRAEKALRKAHDELEVRVRERTADLNRTVSVLQSEVQQRIEAEKAFRSASLYARGLLEANLDLMVTISPDGKITDVNNATEQATGVSREKLIGTDFSSYFTEPAKAREGYKKVMSEGLVRDYPLTIRHISGRTTDVLYNATVYKNEAGKIAGVFADARDVTEIRKIERALWRSEERYRSLTVATTQIVWVTNGRGEVAEDISSWRAFTGQTVDQVKGWGWSEALHPDDRERVKAIWQQCVKTRSLYATEYRLRGRDKQYRCFTARGVPIFEQNGSIREWIGTCTDITERRAAEILTGVTNKLLELFAQKYSKKEYLDSVVETIRQWSGCSCVGIRLIDDEGYIQYASQAGFPQEFIELEDRLSVKKDVCVCIRVITEQMKSPDASLMTSRGSFCCNNSIKFIGGLTKNEKRLFRGNCVRFGYASIAVVPIRYREEVIGAIHLADKEERKVPSDKVKFLENMAMLVGEAVHRFDIEVELRESEERYRRLVELSPDGIGVTSDERIVFINTVGAKLLGGSEPKEFIGKPIMDFVPVGFKERTEKQLRYLYKKWKKLPPREMRFLRSDGTEFDVEVAATPLVYRNRASAQIVFRDIAERKAAEERILADQEQLRSLTAELVLTEERERHTAAAALHDSLGPILSFSKREMGILQKSLPFKAASTLRNISENISKAIEQTRSLTFDLSPPALYTFGFEMATAELAERFCKEKKLEVVFENTDDPKPLSDPVKILLYRSVRELLVNIAKHSQAKVVRIALSRNNGNIKIVVEDDGKGFNISSLNGKTRGFGLFSVRERITHIGGEFDIQSGKGKGTRVTLLAPLELKNE